MSARIDNIIKNLALFERRAVPLGESQRYSALLEKIYYLLVRRRPFAKIKKIIRNYDFGEDSTGAVKKLSDAEAKKFDVSSVGTSTLVGGFTLAEISQNRERKNRERAIRFAAYERSEPIQSRFEVEKKRFEANLILFVRNEVAKRRELIYEAEEEKFNSQTGDRPTGWVSLAVLDRRTSPICAALDGKFYSRSAYPRRDYVPDLPPRHPRCRSILVAVYSQKEADSYASEDLDAFLDRNQDAGEEILGKKKYEEWKKSGRKVNNLLDIKNLRRQTN